MTLVRPELFQLAREDGRDVCALLRYEPAQRGEHRTRDRFRVIRFDAAQLS